MKNISSFDKRVAECVGLWLAEGDRKTRYEITFTNNCRNLVDLFYKILHSLFKNCKNIRIYTYSKEGRVIDLNYKNCIIKHYRDSRARKPYLMVRLASIEKLKEWKIIVEKILNDERLYQFVLRGFFAGEGNIKEGSHNSRVIRISQVIPNDMLEKILFYFNINYSFYPKERNYIIYGKKHWDIFAKLNLADLHSDKKERFWRVYDSFKEEHYEKNYLLKEIYSTLKYPHSARQLSEKFNRSFARIQDVLIALKKQGKIKNFRVKSVSYWTNKPNLIIISKLKKGYLLLLEEPKKTSEIAKEFNVCHKNSFRRLKELERLNLVKRGKDKKWIKNQIKEELIVI